MFFNFFPSNALHYIVNPDFDGEQFPDKADTDSFHMDLIKNLKFSLHPANFLPLSGNL